jgi:tripartite-type tricarboxylate transporter receptor subunit TctC
VRRRAGAALIGAAAMLALSGPLAAQSFPAKPIHVIVPFPPGGSVDLIARTLDPHLRASFGQPIVIDNKPGAAGQLGVELTTKAAPDGYTIVMSSPGAVAINMHFRQLPYDPVKDLVAVTTLAVIPTAWAVNPNLPVKSIADFIAYGKANPGKVYYSVSGLGSQTHLAGELFAAMAGLSMTAVPYAGTRPATAAIVSGEVSAGVSDLATLIPLGDQVRTLAVVDARRSTTAPALPTVAETLPGYVASGWVALFAPAATPSAVVARLNAEFVRALNEPEVRDVFLKSGMEPLPSTVADAASFHATEIAKWGKLIRETNIKIQ